MMNDMIWIDSQTITSKFIMDDIVYSLKMEEQTLDHIDNSLKNKKGCKLSFSFETNTNENNYYNAYNDTKHPLQVYGIVFNAFIEQSTLNDYQIVYFESLYSHSKNETEFLKKDNIYNNMIQRIMNLHLFKHMERLFIRDGYGYALFNFDLSKKEKIISKLLDK